MLKFNFIFFFIVLILLNWWLQVGNINFCWDEPYFIKSSIYHNNFINTLITKEISQENIKIHFNKYLQYTAEHPSLTKIINGLLLKSAQKINLQKYYLLYTYRFSNFIFLILFIISIYKLALFANKNQIFICILLCLLFFNPQYSIFTIMATSDFHMFVFSFLAAYFYLISFKKSEKINLTIAAIFIGFAGAAKINGFFIIPVFFIHSLIFNKKKIKYLAFFLIIPTIIAFIFYPLLWFDTYKNFRALLNFFLKHYQNYVLYFGKSYNPQTDYAPFHYPFFFFFCANPVILISFFLLGFGRWCYKKKEYITTFFILYITTLFVIIIKPNTASYDGIKLFAVCYPFFTWIAADAIIFISEKIRNQSIKLLFWNIIFMSIFIPYILYFSYPSLYYNFFTGSLKNLDAIGFDIDMRGELTDKEIIEILNDDSRNELKIRLVGQNNELFEILKEFKLINKKIICDFNQIEWDYLILLNHKSLFCEQDYHYWNNISPLLEKQYKNIRLWAIFKYE